MSRDQILAILRRHSSDLRRLGAAQLFLFGSASRDEAGPQSDVDLFFDFDDPRFSLIELVALQERISQLLDARADVMSRGSLHPRARESIEQSAVRVF
jgi:predicted nucleotidyltransferase